MHLHFISTVYIALDDASHSIENHSTDTVYLDSSYIFDQIEEETGIGRCANFPSLSQIFCFNSIVNRLKSKHGDLKLVFLTGSDLKDKVIVCCLIACHTVLSHGLGYEEALLLLKPYHTLFEQYSAACGVSVETTLRSFCCAKCLEWINSSVSPLSGLSANIVIDRMILDDRSSHFPMSTANSPC